MNQLKINQLMTMVMAMATAGGFASKQQ